MLRPEYHPEPSLLGTTQHSMGSKSPSVHQEIELEPDLTYVESPLTLSPNLSSTSLYHVSQPAITYQQQPLLAAPSKKRRSYTEKDEASFQCQVPECGKVFSRSYNFKSHMETHDEKRDYPFPCQERNCTREFVRKTDLQRHHQSVHAINYVCDYCGMTISRNDNRRRHMEKCSKRFDTITAALQPGTRHGAGTALRPLPTPEASNYSKRDSISIEQAAHSPSFSLTNAASDTPSSGEKDYLDSVDNEENAIKSSADYNLRKTYSFEKKAQPNAVRWPKDQQSNINSATTPLLKGSDPDDHNKEQTVLAETEPTSDSPEPASDSPESPQAVKASHEPRLRQIGLVRVRIEQVSMFKIRRKRESNEQAQFSDFEEREERDEEGNKCRDYTAQPEQGGQNSGKSTQGGQGSDSQSSSQDIKGKKRVTSSSEQSSANTSDQGDEGGGGDAQRPRRKRQKPDCKKPQQRLACPYQVFYGEQHCLRKSNLNPEGGAADICRLKQHFNRKHKMSYRCQRCWASLDTKRKMQDHAAQQLACELKPMPTNQRFMQPQEEEKIDRYCRQGSEKDAWFDFLRMPIPEIRHYEVSILKQNYWPYYIPPDVTLMMPPIEFPPDLFQESQTSAPAGDLGSMNPMETFMYGPSMQSCSVSLPLLEISKDGPRYNSQFSFYPLQSDTTSPSDISMLGSSSATDSRIAGFTANASSIEPASQTTPGELQHHCNYNRLKKRNQETEEALVRLRAINHNNEQDLASANSQLDALLDSGELINNLYHELAGISTIIGRIQTRLRQ